MDKSTELVQKLKNATDRLYRLQSMGASLRNQRRAIGYIQRTLTEIIKVSDLAKDTRADDERERSARFHPDEEDV